MHRVFQKPLSTAPFTACERPKPCPRPIADLTCFFAGGITQDLVGFRASAIAGPATGWYRRPCCPLPPSPRIPMNKERLIPLIVATALFMENMDSTVIATSLPAIAADIGTSPL